MIAIAAELFHAALDVGIELLADGKIALRGEYRLRRLGGKLAAGIRRAGLHDHRPALHRPRDIDRTANREIFALVIEHVHFRRIEEDAVLHIADPGIVRPAVPQSGDHIVELARAAITFAVLHVLLEAEIERSIRIGSRDDVPAGAAIAEMVERGKAPRDVIRRVERGRTGGNEADVFGDLRQGRQQRERLE